jgi:hypothetical protein
MLGAPGAVIDTACVFSLAEADATPSLAILVQTLLPDDSFRTGHHCSIEDASAALRLVERELSKPDFQPVPPPIHKINIFVGQVDVLVTDKELKALFAPYGNVASAKAIYKGRTTGFTVAFVEFTDVSSSVASAAATAAIGALHGSLFYSRVLTVKLATPKKRKQATSLHGKAVASTAEELQVLQRFQDEWRAFLV